MMRPTLVLQTVCFDDSDHGSAAELGRDLYNQLTRPEDDPLGRGAGIPVYSAVRPECVDLDAADHVVIIPLLGKVTYLTMADEVVGQLNAWHTSLGEGHVLPVPTSTNWRGAEGDLLGKNLLTELYGEGERHRKTFDEIVLCVSRLLGKSDGEIRLFVSHAKADLSSTQSAAKQMYDYTTTEGTGKAFFDATDLYAGRSLADQLENATGSGVFLAVRGDAYSSRYWCQKEILHAKQRGLPMLVVEILRRGEERSSPFVGNSSSVVWDGSPAAVVGRAMVEWLRAAYFRAEARRVIEFASLPGDATILCRPPELLDIAQGPVGDGHRGLVIYPDPELTDVEKEILLRASPRLRMVTPTTAYSRLAQPDERTPANPFEGMQIAMSLSDNPKIGGKLGHTKLHYEDTTVHLARCLISSGAGIAYGGDFREKGFTDLLSDLISAYKQTAADRRDALHSYLATPVKLEDAAEDLPIKAHHMNHGSFRKEAKVPPPDQEPGHPDAMYYSDMRRVMAEKTDARIAIGGGMTPKTEEQNGYLGRYPGVAEEAWRTLKVGKPLYVVGAYGGATGLVATLMEGGETPAELCDATWLEKSARFAAIARTIEEDPYRKILDLPRTMQDLAGELRDLAAPRLASDEAAKDWNGLTVEENKTLFRCKDSASIAALIIKGLMAVTRQKAKGKLEIELVRGSIDQARDLQLLAIGTFDNLPLGGAGAALDHALAGAPTRARSQGASLVQLQSDKLDAEWLQMASLGELGDLENLGELITTASRETAEIVLRHGFAKLGLVAFGGTVIDDVKSLTAAMVEGLAELAGHSTISWFEFDKVRFAELRSALGDDQRVKLTTRVLDEALPAKATVIAPQELVVQVRLEFDELIATASPPSGTGVARTCRSPLTSQEIDQLTHGSGPRGRATPSLSALETRGPQLAELLFKDAAAELLAHCRDAKVVFIHDVKSSRLPFEMLSAKPAGEQAALRPATTAGICRRLSVENIGFQQLVSTPPRASKLRILLVVNPTEDLPGAESEGKMVAQILEQADAIDVTRLWRAEATKDAMRNALAKADVLHYSGHAFFDGPGDNENGLILADGALTLKEITANKLGIRMAFVNACEAGRVRGRSGPEAPAAFAEFFLYAGTEAFLGTYWEVADAAAAKFASGVYRRLADGQRLDDAVRESRAALLEAKQPDWANYLLYGDGRFQLVRESGGLI